MQFMLTPLRRIIFCAKTGTALFLFTILIYTLTFSVNYFDAAENDWFKTHQTDSEALVLGRLVESERNGLSSFQWRLGTYGIRNDSKRGDLTVEAYLYVHDDPDGRYRPYNSQIGLQGSFFSFLDQALRGCCNMDGAARLTALHFIASLLTALSIALLIRFIFFEFGLAVAIVVAVTGVFAQWLVVFGKNLYWSLFLMYLPIAASFYFYQAASRGKAVNKGLVFTVLAMLIFFKCASGFEYITTISVGMALPVLYYTILDRWPLRQFLKEGFFVVFAVLSGFVATFFVHVLQHSIGSKVSYIDALSVRFEHAMQRLHMKTADVSNEVWVQAADASVWDVLGKYWHGHIFNFSAIFSNPNFILLEFNRFVFLFLAFTPIVLASKQFIPSIDLYRRKIFALLVISWVAFCGTQSWYVLAKVHSYFHGHMNHLLWHIPFSFLAIAYMALLTGIVIVDYREPLKHYLSHKVSVAAIVAGLLIIFASMINSTYQLDKHYDAIFQERYKIHSSELFDIYFGEDKMYVRASDCPARDTYSARIKYFDQEMVQNLLQRRLNFKEVSDDFLSKYRGTCVSEIRLTNMKLLSIQIKLRGSRETKVAITSAEMRKMFTINAFPLTDHNWVNGVSPYEPTLFVKNNARNRMFLKKNSYLKLGGSGNRRIREVAIKDQYINVYFYGDKLDPLADGFPNPITSN